jgi:hypothetical protein
MVWPNIMARLEIIAPKKLNFEIKRITLTKLKEDLEKIEKTRESFAQIRIAISDSLSSLPKIPLGELHPIIETLHRR